MSETSIKLRRIKEIGKPILDTQLVGLSRVFFGLPFEHIFDRFKTFYQATQTQSPILQVLKSTIQRQGLCHGLFAGFSSQLCIQVLKQYYRWPMMILVPRHLKENLPKSLVLTCPAIYKSLTGVFIGCFESLIICPLERAKCQLMTRTFSGNPLPAQNFSFRNLYTGIQATLLKQTVSWTNYLYWDHKIRHTFKNSPKEGLTLLQCLSCSLLTAIPNVLFVQPFDTLKTLYQMENNQKYSEKSLVSVACSLRSEKGLIGFYAGWKIRMAQFLVQAVFTTPVIDYLERLHGVASLQ